MKLFQACLLLIFAVSLAACSTGSATDGAGYTRLTMLPPTRTFIVANDVGFAQQVVAHNKQCTQDKLCAK